MTTKQDTPPGSPPPAQPLKMEDQFSELLLGSGVEKAYVPTITKLFFSGNINDLKWLKEVLTRLAAGYVKPHQVSLISSTWSKSRGLPYNPEEFAIEDSEAGKSKKAAEKEPVKSPAATVIEESGIGYKVVKDRDGDWVPAPGGPLTYEAALAAAQKSNTIKALSSGQPVEGSEDTAEAVGSKTAARGGKASRSFQDILLEKVIDDWIDGKKGRGAEDSPQLEALSQQLQTATNTINQMREDREQERFDRIEANIAALASQNPWDDPRGIEVMRQRLGIPNTAVTDSSPAVQLIKDSTDKMDKNVTRLVGIVERAALQSDQFRPEETRSPAEKEQKAGAILDEANKRVRSTSIRKQTFGF